MNNKDNSYQHVHLKGTKPPFLGVATFCFICLYLCSILGGWRNQFCVSFQRSCTFFFFFLNSFCLCSNSFARKSIMISFSSFMIQYSLHYFFPKLLYISLESCVLLINVLLGTLKPSVLWRAYVLHKGSDFCHSEMLL